LISVPSISTFSCRRDGLDDEDFVLGRARSDDITDSIDIWPELSGSSGPSKPAGSFTAVRGGGFLLALPPIEYQLDTDGNYSVWVKLLFQDGAFRKDTYIQALQTSTLPELETEAFNQFGSDIVPIAAHVFDVNMSGGAANRTLDLSGLDDSEIAGAYNVVNGGPGAANIIFAIDDDENFGLEGT
jgi:hypothetical protein